MTELPRLCNGERTVVAQLGAAVAHLREAMDLAREDGDEGLSHGIGIAAAGIDNAIDELTR